MITASGTNSNLCLLIVLALAVSSGCGTAPVKRYGPLQKRVVSKTYAAETETFRAAILSKFKSVQITGPAPFPSPAIASTAPFQSMRTIELDSPNYPPDWLAAWVDPGDFLEPYKVIEGPRRLRDLLIEEPTGDIYWHSEYGTPAGPAKFRCGFIIHFEQKAPALTEIQVYEKAPEIWIGEERRFAHHGIGIEKFHKIRFVQPTVKDRLDMLQALNGILPNK